MVIGVPKESFPDERRVALVPAVVAALVKAGTSVLVEAGSGQAAGFLDTEYEKAGGRIAGQRAEVFAGSEIIVRVRCLMPGQVSGPTGMAAADAELLRRDQVLIGLGDPLSASTASGEFAARGVIFFALE